MRLRRPAGSSRDAGGSSLAVRCTCDTPAVVAAAPGSPSVCAFAFRVRTGAAFLALAQDAIETIVVVASARIWWQLLSGKRTAVIAPWMC